MLHIIACLTIFSPFICDSKLVLVRMVVRHGDRLPTDTYLTDPYANYTYDAPLGSLTPRGKLNVYNVGLEIRNNYDTFLGSHYQPDVFKLSATEIERTQMTALVLAAAIWPPTDNEKIIPTLVWQPIPYTVKPFVKDETFNNIMKFPLQMSRKNWLLQQCPNTSDLQNAFRFFDDYKQIIDYINKQSGYPSNEIISAVMVYGQVEAQIDMGLKPPDWVPIVLKPMKTITAEILSLTAICSRHRLTACSDVQDILNEFKTIITCQSNQTIPKMCLLATHDLTIIQILTCLNMFDPPIYPMFTASLTLELHEKHTRYYVRILFKPDISQSEPSTVLRLSNCGEMCPFRKFEKKFHDFIGHSK